MSSEPETTSSEDEAAVEITFAELGLAPKIQKALDDMGYVTPTPIQAQAIPSAMKGRDVLGIAQTGTGKTAAFTLPTMHKLSKGRARARMPRCLIVCPTRELAAQVAENVELYGKYLKLEMALLIGGVSFAEQDAKLNRGVDILIATPGRLLDQFDRGKVLLTGVQTLIVDEADRMLDMGFIPDIEKIFKLTPFTRQVLFFSATMPTEIKRLVEQFLHQPVTVEVARQSTTADTVTQRIVRLPSSDSKQKRTTLRWLVDNMDVKNGIVFCNRKKDVDIVAKSLSTHGHSAAPIHGDLDQSLRTKTLDGFKTGEIKLLVASDVAARGLDIPDVSHVFNYDVPNHSEDYVHRIGRTGRAGKEGDTIMLVSRLDEKNYNAILSLIKLEGIEEIEVPGIDDFPKEGRKSKRDDRGKGRGRSGGRSDNKSRGDNQRGNASRKPARSSDSSKTDKPKTPHKSEPDSNRKSEAKQSSRADTKVSTASKTRQDTKPRQESKPKRESKPKTESKSGRNDRKSNSDRASGFGENVPAFFNTGLK